MGGNEQDVTIPVYIEVDTEGASSSVSDLKKKFDTILNSHGEEIKSPLDKWNLERALKNLGEIATQIKDLGDTDITIEQWDRLYAKLMKNAAVLDTIKDKYESINRAWLNIPENWTATDNARELAQYLDAVSAKVDEYRQKMSALPKGDEALDKGIENAEAEIKELDELISKIEEYRAALAEAEKNAGDRTREYQAMRKSGEYSDEAVASQKEIADAARESYSEMEKASAEATAKMKHQIQGYMEALKATDEYIETIIEHLKNTPSPEPRRPSHQAVNEAAEAEEELEEATDEEAEATKNSTAQYYYKLRAVKMLGFVVNQASRAVNDFGKFTVKATSKMLSAYLRLIPGINAVRKALDKTKSSQKKLNIETKKAVNTNKLMDMSFKDLVKNILRYGFGIRSIFVLFNKLRRAVVEGLGEMSQQFEDVNTRMSSILTSINYIKASITAMVEPLLTLVAPALEKIAELISNVSYYVASFFAALSGQKQVYRAIKVQADYAESLDKTAKNAKKAKKELAGFDELNVLHTDNDDDKDFTMGWKLVPVLEDAFPLVDKLKEAFAKLFEPIIKAWENIKDFIIESWKYAIEKIKSLFGTIWDTFLKVWGEEATQKIFEDLLKIFGDIGQIIGNIAAKIEEAWKYNDNGYRILAAIRDIIGIIVEGIRKCADATVEWSKTLDLKPLFSIIADVLENKVKPAVQKIVDLFVYLHETVFLELVRYVVEELAPILIEAFGNIVEAVGNIAENIKKAFEDNDRGVKIMEQFEKLVTIVANGIKDASEKTAEWAKNLDFGNLTESILNFLQNIEPLIQFLTDTLSRLWTNVLLPFWQYLLETGFPKLLDNIGQVTKELDWETITENVGNFIDGLEPLFELTWDVLVEMITDVYEAITNLLQSDGFGEFAQNFKDFFDKLREDEDAPARIAEKIEDLIDKFIRLAASLAIASKVILPLATGILTIGNILNTTGIAANVSKIAGAVGGGAGGAAGAGGLTGALSSLASAIPIILAVAAVIGVMIASFGGIDETIAELKERFDEIKQSLSEFAEQVGLSDTIEKLKETFDRLGESAQTLRPIFEFLLDVLTTVATTIGETVIGQLDAFLTTLDGVVTFVSGVFDVIGGLIEAITNFFKGDYAAAEKGLGTAFDGLKEIICGAIETITGVIEGVLEAIAGIVDVSFPNLSKGITDFCNGIKDKFAWLKKVLIGDPIVYDIRDGVVEGFSDFIKDTFEKVSGWVKDIKDKFVEIKDGIGEKLGEAKEKVVTKFDEMKEGASNIFGGLKNLILGNSEETSEGTTQTFSTMEHGIVNSLNPEEMKQSASSFTKAFTDTMMSELNLFMPKITLYINNLIQLFKTKFNEQTLPPIVKSFMTGFKKEYKLQWDELYKQQESYIEKCISNFKSQLNELTLKDTGREVVQGLIDGMLERERVLDSVIERICKKITQTANMTLEVSSPSKVFRKIGNYVTEGLELGLTDDNGFYDNFVSNLSLMKTDAVSIVSTMIEDMDESISDFEPVINFDNVYSKLTKASNIKIPAIVTGAMLPTNAKFKNNNDDLSTLPNMIKDAMIESMADMRYNNNSESGDIIVQIDGYEVFRAVRNQSDMFKNSTGYGVL